MKRIKSASNTILNQTNKNKKYCLDTNVWEHPAFPEHYSVDSNGLRFLIPRDDNYDDTVSKINNVMHHFPSEFIKSLNLNEHFPIKPIDYASVNAANIDDEIASNILSADQIHHHIIPHIFNQISNKFPHQTVNDYLEEYPGKVKDLVPNIEEIPNNLKAQHLINTLFNTAHIHAFHNMFNTRHSGLDQLSPIRFINSNVELNKNIKDPLIKQFHNEIIKHLQNHKHKPHQDQKPYKDNHQAHIIRYHNGQYYY